MGRDQGITAAMYVTRLLLPVLAPQFDLPHALHRGRYMAAVARQERLGLQSIPTVSAD
jgi:hypothetical protein